MCLVKVHNSKLLRQRKRMFRYLIAAGADITLTDNVGASLKDHIRHDQRGNFRAFVRSEISRITRTKKS